MIHLTRAEFADMALRARGDIDHIYVHWTAGDYRQLFPEYHLLIRGSGQIYASTDDWTEVLSHTWHRNTGALGIALCCARDAVLYADGTFDLGDYPPTLMQVESCAMLLRSLAQIWHLPIDEDHIMTHAEAADLDGYGPAVMGTEDFEKWDLWKLKDYDDKWKNGGDVLRGKALYYSRYPMAIDPCRQAS